MKITSIASAFLVMALVSGVAAHETDPATERSGAVLVDGKFYTANSKQPWASGIAIQGKNILDVGDEAGPAGFVGS